MSERKTRSKDVIAKELRQLHEDGVRICTSNLKVVEYKLYKANPRYFLQVKDATAYAGVPLEVKHDTWSESRFKKELSEWIRNYGPVYYNTIRHNARNLTRAIERHYGSPELAAQKFNLPYIRGPADQHGGGRPHRQLLEDQYGVGDKMKRRLVSHF